MNETMRLILLASLCIYSLSGTETPPLDFQSALKKAIENTKTLEMADIAIESKSYDELQAAARPNPELSLETGGTLKTSSATITQPFELGGKRHARMRAAASASCLEQWNREIALADLKLRLRLAFIDVKVAEEKAKIAFEQLNLIKQPEKAKNKLQQKKSEIEKINAGMKLKKAETEYASAKQALAAFWNGKEADISSVDYALTPIKPLGTFEEAERLLETNPELMKKSAEIANACDLYSIELSKRMPDLSVGAGYSQQPYSHNHRFTVSFTIDLPIFDENKGNILKAKAGVAQADLNRRDLYDSFRQKLVDIHANLQNIHSQIMLFENQLFPALQDSIEAAHQDIKNGETDESDITDAKKALLDARSDYLELLSDYHRRLADLERLIE